MKSPVAGSLERAAPEAALAAVFLGHPLQLLPSSEGEGRIRLVLIGAAQRQDACLVASS